MSHKYYNHINNDIDNFYKHLHHINNLINYIQNNNESTNNKFQNGGIISFIKDIYNLLINTKNNIFGNFKYADEIKDLLSYIKDKITFLLNPLNINKIFNESFLPIKTINDNVTIDYNDKFILILCNFLRKLIPSYSSLNNKQIIDNLTDINKIIDNVTLITISIINDFLLYINNILPFINDPKLINNSQSGGAVCFGICIIIIVIASIGIPAIVALVHLIVFGLIFSLIIIGVVIIILVFAPIIGLSIYGTYNVSIVVFNSLFLTINNLISNIMIVLLSNSKHSDLSHQYLKKYDINKSMGNISNLADSSLKNMSFAFNDTSNKTTMLASKGLDITSEVANSTINNITDVGITGINSVSNISATGMSMIGGRYKLSFTQLINNIKSTLSKITNTQDLFNTFVNLLNNFNNKIKNINFNNYMPGYDDIIKNIFNKIYVFIYLELDTLPQLILDIYNTKQKGGYMSNNKSSSFYNNFMRSKKSLDNLNNNTEPKYYPIDKIIKNNSKLNNYVNQTIKNINLKLDNKLSFYYFNKYIKYKNKYNELKNNIK